MTITPGSWDAALEVLASAPSVALACHVGPDGDALGSMLALTIALHDKGVETVASWSDPWEVPKLYSFLPRQELCTPPSAFPAAPDLMVTFDAGSIERLGTLEPNARAARALVVVDHHASNDHYGSINLIDAKAAASAVITYDLLHRLGLPLDRDIASCLYTGLVTDTGRFQYSNTTEEVHQIAGALIAHGAPHDEIARAIYDTHSVGYLKLAARALGRLEVRSGIAWTWITRTDLEENGITIDDIEALIDLVRTTDVADVAAVLKQQSDGRYRVSMRSKGATNVGALCESFGGGGHALAAGFTSPNGEPSTTIDEIISRLAAGRTASRA